MESRTETHVSTSYTPCIPVSHLCLSTG
uniref:Uncharacterized protein n=1 Tax=Anguilla anguilla TaxID=7936 RepID=A0A0E9QXP0_ANGAN